MQSVPLAARVGAAIYVLWALLHLLAAWSVWQLGQTLDESMVRGRVLQDAFNLAAFSVAAIGVAVSLNWRNDRWGYWINLGVVSVADIGFILFVLLPGHLPMVPGIMGPVLWVAAVVASSVGRLQAATG